MDTLLTTEELDFKGILTYPPLEIRENRVTLITGESGTGKTTLLKLFNASLSPTNGRIHYKGQNIQEMDTLELRRKVILVGQNVYLFEGTIRENFQAYYGYRDLAKPDDATILNYLRICQADFSLDSSSLILSGGERQRVYIAICLSFHPEVLMMDEPTSALDQKTTGALMDSLVGFCRQEKITLVLVSHDETLIKPYADDFILVQRRRL